MLLGDSISLGMKLCLMIALSWMSVRPCWVLSLNPFPPVIHVYFSCNSHYCLFFSITILFYFSFFHSYNFLFYNWCYRHWHNMYWDWSNGVVTSGSCMLVFLSSLLFLLYNTCIHGLHVIPFSFIIFPNHWIIIRFLFLNLLTFLSISISFRAVY